MPKVPENWPSGALPRGLDAEMAAYYVGLSVTTFKLRVQKGEYPAPIKKGKRTIWDRTHLDRAMDGRFGETPVAGTNTFDEIMEALGQ